MHSASPPISGPLAEPLRTHARADTWFRFRAPRGLPDQIRELAVRELDLAAEGLWASPGPGLDAGVLYAGSALVKTRVLVRLARAGMKEQRYRDTDRRLRAAGRALVAARDPGTVEEVVERLRQSTRETALKDDFTVLGRRLAETRYASGLAERRDGTALAQARDRLERLHAKARDWTFRADGLELVRPGLRRVYVRARRAMLAVTEKPTSAKRQRRWLRRARSFGYVLSLIEPAWPALIAAWGHEVDRLTGRLRESGELDRLLARAARDASLLRETRSDEVIARVLRVRDHFRAEAIATGRRVFAEPARSFEEKIVRWWTIWGEDGGASRRT